MVRYQRILRVWAGSGGRENLSKTNLGKRWQRLRPEEGRVGIILSERELPGPGVLPRPRLCLVLMRDIRMRSDVARASCLRKSKSKREKQLPAEQCCEILRCTEAVLFKKNIRAEAKRWWWSDLLTKLFDGPHQNHRGVFATVGRRLSNLLHGYSQVVAW